MHHIVSGKFTILERTLECPLIPLHSFTIFPYAVMNAQLSFLVVISAVGLIRYKYDVLSLPKWSSKVLSYLWYLNDLVTMYS